MPSYVETSYYLQEQRRAIVANYKRTHIDSRHRNYRNRPVLNEDGSRHAQGDVFPENMNSGSIAKIKEIAKEAWKGKSKVRGVLCEILDSKQRPDASHIFYVRLKPGLYGIKEFRAVIIHNEILSVNPTRAVGKNKYSRNGVKKKK